MHLVLRLRGGGGRFFTYLNVRIDEKTETYSESDTLTPTQVKMKIAGKLGISSARIILVDKKDKYTQVGNDACVIKYELRYTYKDVAFKQAAGGLWSKSLHEMLNDKTQKEIPEMLGSKKVTGAAAGEDVIYTLIALKLLEQEF